MHQRRFSKKQSLLRCPHRFQQIFSSNTIFPNLRTLFSNKNSSKAIITNKTAVHKTKKICRFFVMPNQTRLSLSLLKLGKTHLVFFISYFTTIRGTLNPSCRSVNFLIPPNYLLWLMRCRSLSCCWIFSRPIFWFPVDSTPMLAGALPS